MKKNKLIAASSCLGIAVVSCYLTLSNEDDKAKFIDNIQKPDSNLETSDNDTYAKKTTVLVHSNHLQVTALIPDQEATYHSEKYGPLARSLRGTKIPAYFETDQQGNLIPTPSIKSLIEYFLSAQGEESLETAIGRIEEYFQTHLKAPASTQAIQILAEYIQYKEALIELEVSASENSTNTTTNYADLFLQRKELRQNNLSHEVYDAFFSEEDKLDTYTSELLTLQREKRLNELADTQTQNRLINLLPESEQKLKVKDRLRNQISLAKQNGASNDELFQLRQKAFGIEAAERYALADKKQSNWNDRYQEYRKLRQSIESNKGLSDYDKEQEVMQLQASLFNKYERKRLPTLDKMADKRETL